jgi:hypothetical protein
MGSLTSLTCLHLHPNDALVTPPTEVCDRGQPAIRSYFLEAGHTYTT